MELADRHTARRIRLRVLSYQFAQKRHQEWDDNWLIVKGHVVDKASRWSFVEPCLATSEATELAEWLGRVALHEVPVAVGGDPDLSFTEPLLAFSVVEYPSADLATVRMQLSRPAFTESKDGWDAYGLDFEMTNGSILEAQTAWLDEIKAFPVR